MARNQTVTSPNANMFALNRVKKECHYEPVRVDFCPISKANHFFQHIIPHFNNDRNFFTPAFILPKQKITKEQSLLSEKNKFQARMFHAESSPEDKTPEYQPTDNNYCQLCQQDFLDYWEHINGKYHKRMINNSKFNKDIIALCKTLVSVNKETVLPKTKHIQKKKTPARQNIKSKNYKKDLKAQLSQEIKNKVSLRTLESQRQKAQIKDQIKNEEKRNIEESLKITLQLANHSTNLLNSNTFKDQFCKNW